MQYRLFTSCVTLHKSLTVKWNKQKTNKNGANQPIPVMREGFNNKRVEHEAGKRLTSGI